MAAQDIVVVKVVAGTDEYGGDRGAKTTDWGRGTLAEAESFCRSPKWPAKAEDEFVALDDWGYGVVVVSPKRPELLGLTRRELHAAL